MSDDLKFLMDKLVGRKRRALLEMQKKRMLRLESDAEDAIFSKISNLLDL